LKGKLTILVSGMIAGVPRQGGATWAVLQYLLGFRRLGHDVYFVEPVDAAALRPEGAPLARSANAAYFRRVTNDFGLAEASALLLAGTRETAGLPYEQLREAAGRADVLVNIAGMLADPSLAGGARVRVYLDLDPAFTQLWHAAENIDMRFDGHTHFVTVGQHVGRPGCVVPDAGRAWLTTLQPVVLEHWPPGEEIAHDALTTVANWRGYGSVEYLGRFYGQKAHSLRRLVELPTLTDEKFVLALAIHPDERGDLAALARNKWNLLDPSRVTSTPADYRQFVRGSKAEFGLAKSGYVDSRCGWFSDRSVCYLAAGRPVVAQETGFSDYLPTGEGLFAFESAAGAVERIRELNADYARHARASRRLAAEFFDSDKVLRRLLRRVGVAS
jgi:hypothetical protein